MWYDIRSIISDIYWANWMNFGDVTQTPPIWTPSLSVPMLKAASTEKGCSMMLYGACISTSRWFGIFKLVFTKMPSTEIYHFCGFTQLSLLPVLQGPNVTSWRLMLTRTWRTGFICSSKRHIIWSHSRADKKNTPHDTCHSTMHHTTSHSLQGNSRVW